MTRPNKTVFMGTTEVPARASREKIMSVLVDRGARDISLQYDARRVSGLSFCMVTKYGPMRFDMPLRVEALFQMLQTERRRQRDQHVEQDRERADRIAWRQLLRWLEAQLGLMDMGMAEDAEVFMPYAVGHDGKTMFQTMTEQRLLGAGK
jgi:hypothetical protein